MFSYHELRKHTFGLLYRLCKVDALNSIKLIMKMTPEKDKYITKLKLCPLFGQLKKSILEIGLWTDSEMPLSTMVPFHEVVRKRSPTFNYM